MIEPVAINSPVTTTATNGSDGSESTTGTLTGNSTGTSTAKAKGEKKGTDSPAFRLRPRRSTPKASPIPTSSAHKRYSVFARNGPILEASVSYTSVESVKRKLFKILSRDTGDEDKRRRIQRPLSPASSIKSEVNLGVFVERINIENLEPDSKYPQNYVCLRIIQVNDLKTVSVPTTDHDTTTPLLTNEETLEPNQEGSQREEKTLSIYAQEADGTSSQVLDPSKAVIKATLYDVYATVPILSRGKVIEVTKFKTEPAPFSSTVTINACDTPVQSLPYTIIIKPTSDWVPIVSIKSQYNSINNPLLLKVDTTHKKSDIPSPGLRFTSYCTKTASSRRSVSVDDLSFLDHGTNGNQLVTRRGRPKSDHTNGGGSKPKNLRSSSKNVSPSSNTATTISPTGSSSSTSTIITSTSPGPSTRMKAVDFTATSASRVSKNSRRVSASP